MVEDTKKRKASGRIWLWSVIGLVLGVIGAFGIGGFESDGVESVLSSIFVLVLGGVVGAIIGVGFGFLRMFISPNV